MNFIKDRLSDGLGKMVDWFVKFAIITAILCMSVGAIIGIINMIEHQK